MKLQIHYTADPTIIKLEAPKILVKGSYEYSQPQEATLSPLAQELLALPFIKTVFISANFIALQAHPIIEWKDVIEEVTQQIEGYLKAEKPLVIEEEATRKVPITIYLESTPNPMAMKFVANKKLVDKVFEFKNVEEATISPLAQALFQFSYVKEVFFDSHYISITRQPRVLWEEIIMELREFIRTYLMDNKPVIEGVTQEKEVQKKGLPTLDIHSRKIIAILDQYVKPAVASDGGHIQFVSYDKEANLVKVLLQGACSGCPSAKRTLKQGIENILRELMKNETITVEAVNN